jgi:DNA-binding beta-propeller fold protein YncE
MPHGMTVDVDGNIYVTDGSRARGQSIRKISIHSGYVSTVAGQKINSLPAETSLVDGRTPAEAIFRLPRDIAFDGGGAFYIVDGWGRRLRKYAIE